MYSDSLRPKNERKLTKRERTKCGWVSYSGDEIEKGFELPFKYRKKQIEEFLVKIFHYKQKTFF